MAKGFVFWPLPISPRPPASTAATGTHTRELRMLRNDVRSFTEADEFAASIRNAGVELSLSTPGPFIGRITYVHLHSLNMQRMSESHPCISHIEPHKGRAYLTFRTAPGPDVFQSGTELAVNSIAWLPPGEACFLRTLGPLHLGAMSLPVDDMYLLATAAGCALSAPPGHLAMTPPPSAMKTLLQLHREAGALAEKAPEILAHPEAARGLEQALVQAMVACFSTSDVRAERSTQRRHRTIMKRFHDALLADPDRPKYVPEMAAAVGTSVRSLTACCQEHLGMAAGRYLMLRRMNLARRALRAADPHRMTVANVAAKFGFWHFGRFAREYKSLFGEAPSVTLRGDQAWRKPYGLASAHGGL